MGSSGSKYKREIIVNPSTTPSEKSSYLQNEKN